MLMISESAQISEIRLIYELLLTATCLNTEVWHALFTCLTRVNGLDKKGADFVVTVTSHIQPRPLIPE